MYVLQKEISNSEKQTNALLKMVTKKLEINKKTDFLFLNLWKIKPSIIRVKGTNKRLSPQDFKLYGKKSFRLKKN